MKERMTYTAVNRILTEDGPRNDRYRDLVEDFHLMKELSENNRKAAPASSAGPGFRYLKPG